MNQVAHVERPLNQNLIAELLAMLPGMARKPSIMGALLRHGEMTVGEIAGVTGRDFHEVDDLVEQLRQLGLVQRSDGGDLATVWIATLN